MAEELKPCPFCGGDAESRLFDAQYFVQCVKCFNSTAADHELESSAIAAWNSRALLPSQGGEAVEVVAYRYTSGQRLGGKWHYQESFPKWDDRKVREIGKMDELMTVAQHNRIVDASKPPDSRVVPVSDLRDISAELGRITHAPFTSTDTAEELASVLIALRALLAGGAN